MNKIKKNWLNFCADIKNFSNNEEARLAQNKIDLVSYLDPVQQNYNAWDYWLLNDYRGCSLFSDFNKPKGKCPNVLKLKYSYEDKI